MRWRRRREPDLVGPMGPAPPRPMIHGPARPPRSRLVAARGLGGHNDGMAKPSPHVPAVAALLASQFAEKEFVGFGSTGELLEVMPVTAAPPAETFTIPPPPWQEQLASGTLDLAALAEFAPHERVNPVDALFAENATWPEWPLDYERPGTPVERFVPEPVDWQQVEREAIRENQRAQREAARALLNEEEEPRRHPPAQRGAA